MDESVHHVNPNPLRGANFLSRLFFCWLNPLFKIGNTRRLETEDLYNVVPDDEAKALQERLAVEWGKELNKASRGDTIKKNSFAWAIFRTFRNDITLLGVIWFIASGLRIVQAILIGEMIRFFNIGSKTLMVEGYSYTAAFCVVTVIIPIFDSPYFYLTQRTGGLIRIASCGMIYTKLLRLSYGALNQSSSGQIINLMSNDVNRFDLSLRFLHVLWIGPLKAVVVLIYLYHKLGPSSLTIIPLILLLIPLQGFMAHTFSRLRTKVAEFTDKRVRIMEEILSGMRVIKMYCWEHMFADLIHKVRTDEMAHVSKAMYTKAVNMAIFFASQKFVIYELFLVYVLLGNVIDAERVFVALLLLNRVCYMLTFHCPYAVMAGSEAIITANRIQTFLLLEEHHEMTPVNSSLARPKNSVSKVIVHNISATWIENSHRPTLKNVSFELGAGELLAVIGPVGAGKSSLLMALLGELPNSEGSIVVNGGCAYASQQPWVFSSTVRQNIICGQTFDEQRYMKVVAATDLLQDFLELENGDQTLVGDRGVKLSGGQKARISLARAIYYDANIYLMDDPLSAVDAVVGRHLFDQCIMGVLNDKPRILVTHQLQYLKGADKILVLEKGEQVALGSFESLMNQGVEFTSLLENEVEEGGKVDKVEEVMIKIPEGCGDVIKSDTAFDHEKRKSHNSSYLSHHARLRSYSLDAGLFNIEIEDRKKELLHKRFYSADNVNKITSNTTDLTCESSNPKSLPKAPSVMDVQKQEQKAEDRAEGNVGAKVWFNFLYSGRNAFGIFLLLITNILAEGTFLCFDFWLSFWSDQEELRAQALNEHSTFMNLGFNETNVTIFNVPEITYVGIFTGVTASLMIFGFLRALWAFHFMVLASRNLHNRMLRALLRTPILFVDANPIGRILNRFSKDMGLVDEILPQTMYHIIQYGMPVFSFVIVCAIINPWVFIPMVVLCVCYIFLVKYYISTSRDVIRIEATHRSPVYSHVVSTLQGLHTIRAHQVVPVFNAAFYTVQDLHTSSWLLFVDSTRWFAIRSEGLCIGVVIAVALMCLAIQQDISGSQLGIILFYAQCFLVAFEYFVRQMTEAENQMTSVERILQYAKLSPEAALDTVPDTIPHESWPQKGTITGQDVSFRHSPESPVVLKNLSFKVQAREKIGICGRTGAGKSSFISMLFRMAAPNGTILIDDIDISTLGLHDLRQKISIIPQDPVLFYGSVRQNLDPFDQQCDDELWKVLDQVHMKSAVNEMEGGLQAKIVDGGKNLSVGQRQLVCLARAMLRVNKILVIDEATANIDNRTDALIQQTIREKFADCTVLTIAHRLNTIMDSDRIMVLEAGEIVEFDAPFTLLKSGTGIFHGLVGQIGRDEADKLMGIAKEAYVTRCSHDLPSSMSVESVTTAL